MRGLCIVFMLALGLSTSACTVVGFVSGVAATNKRDARLEARLNAKATHAEREACREAKQDSILAEREDQAVALVKTAVKAARSGDCATTIEIEHRVRDLDANVHNAWFVRDDAIKACLDSAQVESPVAEHEPREAATKIPGCTDREIRAARKAQLEPSSDGTIAGRVIAGLVIDLVVIAVLYAYALGSVPSH